MSEIGQKQTWKEPGDPLALDYSSESICSLSLLVSLSNASKLVESGSGFVIRSKQPKRLFS
jgi:hypothetical protein